MQSSYIFIQLCNDKIDPSGAQDSNITSTDDKKINDIPPAESDNNENQVSISFNTDICGHTYNCLKL